MNCLLIEDSPLKAGLISKFIGEDFSHVQLRTERSYQSGLKAALEDLPSAIILDMTLPNFDVAPGVRHGKPRPLGGYDLLRKLRRADFSSHVLVVTQYELFGSGALSYSFSELSRKCLDEFPGLFVGIVHFSAGSSEWKFAISTLLSREE